MDVKWGSKEKISFIKEVTPDFNQEPRPATSKILSPDIFSPDLIMFDDVPRAVDKKTS